MSRSLLVLVLGLVVVACGEPSQSPDGSTSVPADASAAAKDAALSSVDASLGSDTGGTTAPDTGTPLAADASATEADAATVATDAALTAADAAVSAPPDAAVSSTPDAALSAPDASSANLCAAAFAGCTTYQDATAGGPQTISFAPVAYSPKCLKVAAGQTVTFSGSFSFHPLSQACGPADVITDTSSGTSKSFVFAEPGTYGYYCTAHGSAAGSGMAGSILVE
ncbi:MAG: hypothetical protein QM765_34835 [Myxococcales bacterium]